MRLNPLVIVALAAATRLAAQDAPPIARYVPAAPDPRHVFVMDSAHILSASEIGALQDSAKALQAETGADVAWVTLPTLGGRAIEEATVYLGRAWKVGSAGNAGDPLRNRGLVILYVPDKSTTAGSNFRVEVGKGLQGTIIDSRSRAISAAMRDDLRAKRYDAAYAKGWNVAAGMVREDYASQHAVAGAGGAPDTGAAAARARGATTANAPTLPTLPSVSVSGFAILLFVILAVVLVVCVIAVVRRTGFGPGGGLVTGGPSSSGDWSSSSGSDSSDSSASSDSGGDFGGGGGFDGGGSSDSI